MTGPPGEVVAAPPPQRGGHHTTNPKPTNTTTSGSRTVNATRNQWISSSRQVAWWPVHEFVVHLVAQVGHLPVAGTPAWQALSDDDPRKLLSLAVAGEHYVLRVETAQEAMAEASRAVAAAADWPQVAREVHARSSFRANHPWAKRVLA